MTQALSFEDETQAGDGLGRRARRQPEAADATRVDVQAARRQSSVRRRPTREAEAAAATTHARNGGATPATPATPAIIDAPVMPGSLPDMPAPQDPPPGVPLPPDDAAPNGDGGGNLPDRPAQMSTGPLAAPAGGSSSKNQRGFNKHVCPFCGTKREQAGDECPHCGMLDSDETRAATVARIGPWFLLQPRNPSAPGMRFSVLRELVRGGQVLAGSVVRGPTTHQLWTYAARVRGLGQLYGICWSCNRRLPNVAPGEDADDFCLYCGALQEAPANPDQQLEVLATVEAAGASPSPLAGQVNQTGPSTGGVVIHKTASASGAAATPAAPRRINTPRPLPATPNDGGDALLSTRELATAFNLDRKRSFLGFDRFPWVQALLALAALAFIVVGLWVAASVLWTPVMKMIGGSGDKNPPAKVERDAPPAPEPEPMTNPPQR